MHKKYKFIFFLLILILITDFFIGKILDIKKIRNDAYLFRNQAQKLAINTRYLKPNIFDKYQLSSNTFETTNDGFQKNINTENRKTSFLFLGGSTTENNEVTSANRFHNLLNEKFLDKEIYFYNGGVRGNTTLDTINLLTNHESYKRGFDYYVMMHNINDRNFLNEFPNYKFFFDKNNFDNITFGYLYSQLLDKLTYKSNIIFFIRYKFFYFFPWADKVDQIYKNQNTNFVSNIASISAFEENIKIFIAIIKSRNSIPILMTQPLGFVDQEQIKFNNIIRDVAVREKIFLIDLEKKIEGKEYFLGDGVHFNDNGSILASRIIQENIEKHIATKNNNSVKKKNFLKDIELKCKNENNKYQNFDLNLIGRYPVLSPYLSKMAIQIFENKKSAVLILNSDKEIIKKITHNKFNIRHPFFINENKIIFSQGDLKEENILLYDLSTDKTVHILKEFNFFSTSIGFYADNKILFAGTKIIKNNVSQPDIYIFNIKSNALEKITDTDYEEWRPVYDDVNGFVYFIGYENDNFDLFVYNENTKRIDKIFFSNKDEWDPIIDVLNNKLFFSSKVSGNWNIFFNDRKSNETKQITFGITDKWDPFVRPDLKAVFYAEYDKNETKIKFLCY